MIWKSQYFLCRRKGSAGMCCGWGSWYQIGTRRGSKGLGKNKAAMAFLDASMIPFIPICFHPMGFCPAPVASMFRMACPLCFDSEWWLYPAVRESGCYCSCQTKSVLENVTIINENRIKWYWLASHRISISNVMEHWWLLFFEESYFSFSQPSLKIFNITVPVIGSLYLY